MAIRTSIRAEHVLRKSREGLSLRIVVMLLTLIMFVVWLDVIAIVVKIFIG
ncbi:MAG: hypothetical protein IJV62_00370 [Eggerthellaceae bacterium]|nr:hypothetical protein [Eggerthellaceae bacterium]